MAADDRDGRRTTDTLAQELDSLKDELREQRIVISQQGNVVAAQYTEFKEHYAIDERMHATVNESMSSIDKKLDSIVNNINSISDFIIAWQNARGFKNTSYWIITRIILPAIILWQVFTGGVRSGLKLIVDLFRG